MGRIFQLYGAGELTAPLPDWENAVAAPFQGGEDGALRLLPLGEGLHFGGLWLPVPLPGELAALGAFCRRRGVKRIFCDAEDPSEALRLSRELAGYDLAFPETAWPGEGKVLVSTALSGGTLAGRFREALTRWGPDRVIAAAEPMEHFFALPAPSGEGRFLRPGELAGLRETARWEGYSEELGCRVLLGREGAALWDDEESLARKCRLLFSLGVEAVLRPAKLRRSGR